MKWYLCANYRIFPIHFQDLWHLHMTFPFLLTVYWIFAFWPAEEKGNLHRDLTVIHTAINFSPLTYFSCNLYKSLPRHSNKHYILFFFNLKSPQRKSLLMEHQVQVKLCTSFYHSFLCLLVYIDVNLNYTTPDQVVYILLSFVSWISKIHFYSFLKNTGGYSDWTFAWVFKKSHII